MAEYSIYNDITNRTGGDVYIGVVGPVRTGKSTFIKKFMDTLVIPNIEDEYLMEQALDELPQSASGKTIMTTEPKFIPNEAVEINLNQNAHMRVRMIDCVGYIVKSASGYMEDGRDRMIQTPWFEDAIPFNEAAEIGTKKVICDHSTIGIVVTTDGSIGDIDRKDYEDAEERVIRELKDIGKPFIILLNSRHPGSDSAAELKKELEGKYKVSVLPIDCLNLGAKDISEIMETLLFEFPVSQICINLPSWICALKDEHPLKRSVYDAILKSFDGIGCIRDVKNAADLMREYDFAEKTDISSMDLSKGAAQINISAPEEMFYNILSEMTGLAVESEDSLISIMCELADTKKQYDKFAYALHEVEQSGYGIVSPGIDDLELAEPEIVRQGARFGVRLKATAPSIHMIRANVETEVSPIVGSEKQSEELVEYLLSEFDSDPKKIWESNIFGKSLHELVNEGLRGKLTRMPDEARNKLSQTLGRIINEGCGGLICIIL